MERDKDFEKISAHRHIVICGDNINALSILRSLGEKGLRPTVIVLKEGHIPLVSKCRYVGELIECDTFQKSFETLLSMGDKDCPPFVYTSDDNHQCVLDMHYEELKDRFYFFNAGKAGRVTYFMDKKNICNEAKECGFEIAESEVLVPGELPQNLKYPVITKTLNPYAEGWKRDVGVYYSAEELAEGYKDMISEQLLVQEYVEKKNELSMQGFSIDGGKIVYLPFKRQYFRFTKTTFGSYCYYKTYDDKELENRITELIRRIGYSGNFEIEFLEKKDSDLVFLEINFRHALSNYASNLGGINLPYEWAKATLNHNVDGLVPTRDYFTAMNEPKDFDTFVKKGNMSYWAWLKDYMKADSYYLMNRKDIRPVLSFYTHKVLRKLKKITYKNSSLE